MNNSTTGEEECIICSHNISILIPILQFTIGVFVTLENVYMLSALSRCNRMKKPQRLLLINQTVTDVAVGVVFSYHSVAVYVIYHELIECFVRYFLASLTSAVSLQVITMLSLERIVAIKFPYHYHKLSSMTYIVLGEVLCFFGPVVIVIGGFLVAKTDIRECNFVLLASKDMLFYFAIPSLCLILIIIACNIYLFQAALTHIKKIIPTIVGKEKYVRSIKMHLKATATSVSVVVPFVVLNIPQYLFFLYLGFRQDLRSELSTLYGVNAVFSLVVLNSIVNPFIYAWRIEELRSKIKRFLNKKSDAVWNVTADTYRHEVNTSCQNPAYTTGN